MRNDFVYEQKCVNTDSGEIWDENGTCSALWSHLHHACMWMCGTERGLWELGGGRDTGLGNGYIFNGRESEGPGVRPSEQLHY